MAIDPDRIERCRSCGAPVLFAHHVHTGKPTPLQAVDAGDALAARGTFTITELGGRLLYQAAGPGDGWPRYVSHFATCPQADEWRVVPVQAHHRVVRRTDPDTSREAAATAVLGADTLRARVLDVFMAAKAPITDEQLAIRYSRRHPTRPASPSGLRTRRSELERDGLVAVVDTNGKTENGRRCRRYMARTSRTYTTEPPVYRDWTEHDCLMTNEWGGLCSLPARLYPTRGRARAAFASEWGCGFLEVESVRKEVRVWDPLDAAARWREERCDDSDDPCGAFDEHGERTGQECTCPWPKDVQTFWDESGYYCPWRDPLPTDPPEKKVAMWVARASSATPTTRTAPRDPAR